MLILKKKKIEHVNKNVHFHINVSPQVWAYIIKEELFPQFIKIIIMLPHCALCYTETSCMPYNG